MDESMIARQDAYIEKTDVWTRLAAPVADDVIAWRQDGKATIRDGRYFARFVAYIEANTVRERLDQTVPGEWDLTLELLPAIPGEDGDGSLCSFKARLQILGVIREDIGTGRDYKQASTDAFKRAAVRFGIGHELYGYEQNWVEVDGDGKYAKPLEEPQLAYARRHAEAATPTHSTGGTRPMPAPTDGDAASCPKCDGPMWDNRLTKRNPRAPDYKCQNRSCDGVIWPSNGSVTTSVRTASVGAEVGSSGSIVVTEEELPF
jgi:hypothetical protein